jgi:hypothetical protein
LSVVDLGKFRATVNRRRSSIAKFTRFFRINFIAPALFSLDAASTSKAG